MKSARLLTVSAIAAAVAALAAGAAPASASIRPNSSPARAGIVVPARLSNAFPADSFTCHDQTYLNSSANADYVSAEFGYTGQDYGMLRARATTVGPWEKYDFCYDSTQGWWSISSDVNGLFVTANFGYSGASFGELTASSTTIGPYQKWIVTCVPGPPVSPQIEYAEIQAQTNLNYVSAELGYTGADYAMLRARAATAGPWEKYYSPNLCP